MSISGIFLMLFLIVHLTVNLMLILDDSGELFNIAAHFMVSNPIVRAIEPLLGLGFLVHIIWSFYLEYQNWKARPVKYNKKEAGESSSWASRNMLILGALVLVFLVIHIINFYWVLRFTDGVQEITIGGEHMEDSYSLVAGLFKTSILYDIIYIVGAILLGLHLSHGFWSSFHTLGLSNKNWLGRLQFIGKLYAVIITVGFAIIPLYFLIKF